MKQELLNINEGKEEENEQYQLTKENKSFKSNSIHNNEREGEEEENFRSSILKTDETSSKAVISYEDIFKIYKFKLKKLKDNFYLKPKLENYWDLLIKNHKNLIDKVEFLKLFVKIYKVILPIFNYGEIIPFLESEWALLSKE